MEQLIQAGLKETIWAALFISLLVYVIRRNDLREDKLQNIINKLADKLNIVEGIKKDVDDIKSWIEQKG